jgi:hypothetical protein
MNPATHDSLVTSIKRSDNASGLDGLFDYTASDVENESRIEVVKNGVVDQALFEFNNSLEKRFVELFNTKTDLQLNFSEIYSFIHFSKVYKTDGKYDSAMGLFLSKLINNCYHSNKGHKFSFDLSDLPKLGYLMSNVRAKDNLPLELEIYGDVGTTFGLKSENLKVIIHGNVKGYFFEQSDNNEAFILGNTGMDLGRDADNFNVVVGGDVNGQIAFCSNQSNYVVLGDINSSYTRFPLGTNIFVGGQHQGLDEYANDSHLFIGNKAQEHPTYKRMASEWKQRFER